MLNLNTGHVGSFPGSLSRHRRGREWHQGPSRGRRVSGPQPDVVWSQDPPTEVQRNPNSRIRILNVSYFLVPPDKVLIVHCCNKKSHSSKFLFKLLSFNVDSTIWLVDRMQLVMQQNWNVRIYSAGDISYINHAKMSFTKLTHPSSSSDAILYLSNISL